MLLGTALTLLLVLGREIIPAALGHGPVDIAKTQLLYMGLVVVVLVGISSLLFRYRYEQYRDKRRLEVLNAQLQVEKQRSDEQAERLARLEEQKSRFFSNVTHEFRTPLTLILGPLQDAMEGRYGRLDPALLPRLQLIQRNGLRLQTLITQLLDLSRIDAGGMRLKLCQGDLVAFVHDLYRSFTPLAERKQIAFHHDSNCSRLLTSFDPDLLEKVIGNLLNNAFKFTPQRGHVRVSVVVGDDLQVRIRDSGPGIPDDELPNLFDRFHQVDSVSSDVAGSGIGLALARELAEMHGGTIRVESEVGFGTQFTLVLPINGDEIIEYDFAETPGPAADLLEVATQASGGDGVPAASVLVIDDNEDVRLFLRDHLEPRYHVIEATNGRDGIAAARSHRPGLVICDVMMPEMDGMTVCKKLKSHASTRDIPVVLLTAKATDEARLEGLAALADDYIVKPFSTAELLARVENLIELRSLLRQTLGGGEVFRPSDPGLQSSDQRFLDTVRGVIEKHLGNSNFGVEWLADEVALSSRQLQRRLQSTVGLSAAGVIRMMRLQRAAQLLEARAGTVAEIAYMVGFQDPAYFARLFRQTHGLTPTAYAERELPLVDRAEGVVEP